MVIFGPVHNEFEEISFHISKIKVHCPLKEKSEIIEPDSLIEKTVRNRPQFDFSQPVTSMLVTDVGDEMWWWKLLDVGDGFVHFGCQDTLFYISVGYQHSKDFTNIHKTSLTLSRNITMSPISLSPSRPRRYFIGTIRFLIKIVTRPSAS